jgi:hypothetical protein
MRLRTIGVLTLFCAGFALAEVARASHSTLKINMLYDKRFARAVGARPADGGAGRAQPGEEWDGTAPVPDGALTGSADIREFQVLSDFNTIKVTATISWSAGLAVSYDLDLYIDRLDAVTGDWEQVGSGTDGQLAGDGLPTEDASVDNPPAGRYRTRVVNFASTETAYHGTLGFTSGKSGGKPSRGRATADRLPDEALGSQAHAIYFVPFDVLDQTLDTNGVIENSILSTKGWLESQTGGKHIRLDTYTDRGTTRLDVSFVLGNLTAADYAGTGDAFTAVTDELEARGWNADPSQKRYYVYYEGPAEDTNICGTAFVNTLGTGFAQWSVVWLGADPGCGARDFGTPETGPAMSESILLHESTHNEGLVRPESLHHCWAFQFHLCSAGAGAALELVDHLDPEYIDLMFPFVTVPLREKVLDRDNDDYYAHPFPTRDLDESPYWED